MPHPRSLVNPKIPRFSNIIKSDAPVALQSPHAHENAPVNGLPAPSTQPFNPRVAAYTFAFVSVLIGGLYVGATSKDIMESREQRKEYESLPTEGKIANLRKLRESLLQQRERLEDRVALIRIQAEDEERKRPRKA